MTVRALFHDRGDLSSRLRATGQTAMQAVREMPAGTVLNTPEADLVDQLYAI